MKLAAVIAVILLSLASGSNAGPNQFRPSGYKMAPSWHMAATMIRGQLAIQPASSDLEKTMDRIVSDIKQGDDAALQRLSFALDEDFLTLSPKPQAAAIEDALEITRAQIMRDLKEVKNQLAETPSDLFAEQAFIKIHSLKALLNDAQRSEVDETAAALANYRVEAKIAYETTGWTKGLSSEEQSATQADGYAKKNAMAVKLRKVMRPPENLVATNILSIEDHAKVRRLSGGRSMSPDDMVALADQSEVSFVSSLPEGSFGAFLAKSLKKTPLAIQSMSREEILAELPVEVIESLYINRDMTQAEVFLARKGVRKGYLDRLNAHEAVREKTLSRAPFENGSAKVEPTTYSIAKKVSAGLASVVAVLLSATQASAHVGTMATLDFQGFLFFLILLVFTLLLALFLPRK